MSLEVEPKDIDSFDPSTLEYMVGVGADVAEAKITPTAASVDDDRSLLTAPRSKAADPHTVSLCGGAQHLRGRGHRRLMAPTTTYTVHIGRGTTERGGWKASDDLDTLRAAGNTEPWPAFGLTTPPMWIADSVEPSGCTPTPSTAAPATRAKDITLAISATLDALRLVV